MTTRLLVIVSAMVALAGLTAAYFVRLQQQTSQVIYQARSITTSTPQNYTQAQEDAYIDAFANNLPFPPGFAKVSDNGSVTATLTGVFDPQTLEKQLVVTVRDDTSDLDIARLYLNSVLVFTATRASGSIVDRNGSALATLSTLVPGSSHYALEVRWVSTLGVEMSHAVVQ
jgi:uncharacterized membrane protein